MVPVRVFRALSSVFAPLALVLTAGAQTTVWTGTANTTWDNASNWDNGVPDASTDAIIASAVNQPSNFILGPECRDLTIQALATLSLNGGFDLTASGDLLVSGTLDVGSSSSEIAVDGDWTNDGTYNHGGGSVELTGNGSIGGINPTTFEELVISGGTRTVAQNFTVNGDVTVDSGVSLALNGSSYVVGGNWTSSASGISISGTGTIEFTGNGVLTTGSNSVPNVLISAGLRNVNQSTISGNLDMTAGQLQILDNAALSVGGAANLSGGILGFTSSFAGDETLDVDGDCTITATAGTFSSESLIRCGGDWTSTSAFAPSAGTVELDEGTTQNIGGTAPSFVNLKVVSGNKTMTTGATISADLTVQTGAALTTTDTLDIDGKVVLGDASASWNIGSATHTVQGNWSSAGGSATGTGSIHFDGAGGLVTGGGTITDVLISAGARNVLDTNVDGDLTMTGGSLTVFDNQTLAVSGNCVLSAGTLTFNDSLAGDETLDVDGDLTITATSGGTAASTVIRCGGNWSSTSAFAPATGLVSFDSGSVATISGTAPVFPNVEITSGAKTINAASTVGGNLTVISGATLDTSDSLAISGSVTLGDGTSAWALGAATHTVGGSFLSAGASATGTGTIEFNSLGGGLDSGGGTLANVVISSGSYAVQTTTVTGNLDMTAGALTIQDNQSLAVQGNASLTGGTLTFSDLTAGNETLDVDGNLVLTLVSGGTSTETLVRCGGDYTSSGTFAPTAGLFELDSGSGANFGGVGINFPNLTLVSGTKTLTDACSVSGDLTVDAGSVLIAAASFDIDGKVLLSDSSSAWDVGASTHTVAGNFTSTGGSATGAGTIEFDGPGGLITGGGTITNVLISAGDRSVLNTDVIGDLAMTSGGLVVFDNQTLTVSGDLTLSGGTLTFQDTTSGDETLDVEGNAVMEAVNGGTSDATIIRVGGNWTSSATWSPTAGLVELDGGSSATVGGGGPIFHDLDVVSGSKQVLSATSVEGDLTIGALSDIDADAAMNVDGNVALTATSTWDLGVDTHTVGGDYISLGGSATGTGTIEFDDSGTLDTGGGSVPNVLSSNGFRVINTSTITDNLTMTAGGITIADNQTVSVGADAILSGGQLTFGDTTAGDEILDIDGDATFACSAGAHNSSTLIQCAGNWTSVAVYAPAGGLVQLDGGSIATLSGANPTFFDLEITSGTKTVTAASSIANNLTVLDGTVLDTDAALDIDGQVVLGSATASWDVGASTHTIAGSWTSSGCSAIGAGTIEFDGPGTLLPTTGTLPSMHVSAGERTCFGTTLTGDLTLTGGGITVQNNRTISVAGNASLTAGTLTWIGDGLGVAEGLDVEGDCVVLSAIGGESVDSLFTCAGSWTSDGTFAQTLGSVELDGSGSTTIDGSGTAFGNLLVTGGTKTLLSAASVAGNLTLANTTALVSTAAWDVDGNVSLGDASASFDLGASTHLVGGDWISLGADATGAGTVRFDGTGILQTNPGSVPNVEITAGFRLVQDSTVNGNLSMTAGGVTIADNQTLSVNGNLNFSAGTLTFLDTLPGFEVIDVEGNANVAATAGGHSTNSRIFCAGNWSGNASYSPAAGTVTLDGLGATTISGTATNDPTFSQLTLTGGPRTAANSFTLDISTLNIDASSSLDLGAQTVGVPAAAVTVAGQLSVGAGGNLKLGALSAVSVVTGGTLSLIGAAGNRAVVDGYSGGGYLVNIDGTLEAGQFRIADTGASGIIVNNSAILGAAPNDLRNGEFSGPSGTINSVMLDVRRPAPTTFRNVDFSDPGGVGTFNVRVLSGSPINFINSAGDFSGPGFEQDPFNLVEWEAEGTVLSAFAVTPGPDTMTIDWTSTIEIDVANYVIARATNMGGPFTTIATPAAVGPNVYQFVDTSVIPGQLYVYELSENLNVGGTQLLDSGFGKPWGSAPPPNFLTVGGGGAFTDIQSAITAAAGVTNPVISIAPGTYAPFVLTPLGPSGTVRITGDGTGAVTIDTTTGPVQILGMGFFNNVELADLEIGSGASGNDGLVIQNSLGVVVVDGVTAHGGGAGLAGIRVDNSQSVAIQKCIIDGDSGLVVQNASRLVASLGSLDDLEVLSASNVRTTELTTVSTVDPGAVLTEFAGAAADVEMERLVSIGDPFTIDLAGEPNAAYLLLLGSDYLWLDLAVDADMVGLTNLVPGTVLFAGALSGAGGFSLPLTMPESGAFYGTPFLFQMIHVNISTFRPSWSSVATLIGKN